jgi:hypothetical protein
VTGYHIGAGRTFIRRFQKKSSRFSEKAMPMASEASLQDGMN